MIEAYEILKELRKDLEGFGWPVVITIQLDKKDHFFKKNQMVPGLLFIIEIQVGAGAYRIPKFFPVDQMQASREEIIAILKRDFDAATKNIIGLKENRNVDL